jgi:acyl-CoA hydrolase
MQRQVVSTEFGVPIDHGFGYAAPEASIQKASAALEAHGFAVKVVDTAEDARAYVRSILPKDRSVFTSSSETLRISGLEDDINGSGEYNAVRTQLDKLDRNTQMAEMKRLSATPDVVVGSVHAITEDGRILIGSGSGSQLGPYAYGAGKVIWVVGSQKVVPDLETGLRRVQLYSYPKEDIRLRGKYGMPSSLNKILIENADRPAGRSTIVLIREPIGF